MRIRIKLAFLSHICRMCAQIAHRAHNLLNDILLVKGVTMKRSIIVILSCLLLISINLYAGDLEPTAAPGPTMKTLDRVEPRIPITQNDIPLTIGSSGSYYLTQNVTSSTTAITVAADDVTIDLMGYTITGSEVAGTYGVYMNRRKNVEIRNGTVQKFYTGILEASSSSSEHRIINIRSEGNVNSGIHLSGYCNIVKDCTVTENGLEATASAYGIYAYYSSRVEGNVVCSNGRSAGGYFYGIYAPYGCIVKDNIVNNNGYMATAINYGIYAYSGGTVTGNSVFDNGDYTDGNFYGIYTNFVGTISGNSVNTNGSHAEGDVYGIRAGGGAVVKGNTVNSNGYDAANSFGIYLSSYCMADQNSSYNNYGTNMYVGTGCSLGTNVAP